MVFENNNAFVEIKQKKLLAISENDAVKTLGLTWYPVNQTKLDSHHQITKRTILSNIALLFDPLGITGPMNLTAKVNFQQLWRHQFDLDDPLKDPERAKWMKYKNELLLLQNI
jgi:hypothetical protein